MNNKNNKNSKNSNINQRRNNNKTTTKQQQNNSVKTPQTLQSKRYLYNLSSLMISSNNDNDNIQKNKKETQEHEVERKKKKQTRWKEGKKDGKNDVIHAEFSNHGDICELQRELLSFSLEQELMHRL